MTQLIFINLPVADLNRSIAFYEAVGATKNPMFSDETAACMVLSDVIHVMLLTHDKWRTFTDRAIPDARASAQMLLCLSRDSREAVDAVVAQAGAAAERRTPTNLRTTASCMAAAMRTRTATSGRPCGWIPPPPPPAPKPSPPMN